MKNYKIIIFITIALVFLSISILVFYKYENNRKFFLEEIDMLEKKIINYDKKNSKLQSNIVKKFVVKDKIIKRKLYNNFSKKAQIENIDLLDNNYTIERYELIFVPRSGDYMLKEITTGNLKNTGYIEISKDNNLYINGDGTLISFKI